MVRYIFLVLGKSYCASGEDVCAHMVKFLIGSSQRWQLGQGETRLGAHAGITWPKRLVSSSLFNSSSV